MTTTLMARLGTSTIKPLSVSTTGLDRISNSDSKRVWRSRSPDHHSGECEPLRRHLARIGEEKGRLFITAGVRDVGPGLTVSVRVTDPVQCGGQPILNFRSDGTGGRLDQPVARLTGSLPRKTEELDLPDPRQGSLGH